MSSPFAVLPQAAAPDYSPLLRDGGRGKAVSPRALEVPRPMAIPSSRSSGIDGIGVQILESNDEMRQISQQVLKQGQQARRERHELPEWARPMQARSEDVFVRVQSIQEVSVDFIERERSMMQKKERYLKGKIQEERAISQQERAISQQEKEKTQQADARAKEADARAAESDSIVQEQAQEIEQLKARIVQSDARSAALEAVIQKREERIKQLEAAAQRQRQIEIQKKREAEVEMQKMQETLQDVILTGEERERLLLHLQRQNSVDPVIRGLLALLGVNKI